MKPYHRQEAKVVFGIPLAMRAGGGPPATTLHPGEDLLLVRSDAGAEAPAHTGVAGAAGPAGPHLI